MSPIDPYEFAKGYAGNVLLICGDADGTGAYDNTLVTKGLYDERESGMTLLETIEGGGHGYGSFDPQQKERAIAALKDWLSES